MNNWTSPTSEQVLYNLLPLSSLSTSSAATVITLLQQDAVDHEVWIALFDR